MIIKKKKAALRRIKDISYMNKYKIILNPIAITNNISTDIARYEQREEEEEKKQQHKLQDKDDNNNDNDYSTRVINYCADTNKALLICTTGYSKRLYHKEYDPSFELSIILQNTRWGHWFQLIDCDSDCNSSITKEEQQEQEQAANLYHFYKNWNNSGTHDNSGTHSDNHDSDLYYYSTNMLQCIKEKKIIYISNSDKPLKKILWKVVVLKRTNLKCPSYCIANDNSDDKDAKHNDDNSDDGYYSYYYNKANYFDKHYNEKQYNQNYRYWMIQKLNSGNKHINKFISVCERCNRKAICIKCQYSNHGDDYCRKLVCLDCVQKCEDPSCYMYFCPQCYCENRVHK